MISIIIPVYNEASTIGTLLKHLDENSRSGQIGEVIIVDGQSSDDTLECANNYINNGSLLPYTLISSQKGRACQMNTGASRATGDILYFLHADTLPPEGFDLAILEQVKAGFPAGCFRLKFDTNHPILTLSQWFTRFNFRACRGGDQSLFVTSKLFEELKGFNEDYMIYEDCEFINRIYDDHRFSVIDDHVITSSRKYRQNGTIRLQYHFGVIHFKKWLGASPGTLMDYYQKHITG